MKTYLVGGAIRDKLLNIPVRDRDWVVVGSTPKELTSLGFSQVGKGFPVFLHPKTKQEYALARTEKKISSGHTGFKINAAPDVTLEEDLKRRDLTINAIAESAHGELIDPYGGRQDIKDRKLRHVSEAFREDPLRVLRVARFAAKLAHLGFSIAEETLLLMEDISQSDQLETLSSERVWQELESALMTTSPAIFISTLRDCGALKTVLPEVNALFGVPQPKEQYPAIDTGLHALLRLEQAAKITEDTVVRFATLIQDVGKGVTEKSQWPSHHGYELLGLPLQVSIAKRMRIPKEHAELAALVCEHHTKLYSLDRLAPSTVLSLLESLDAIRRPVRLEKFLLACEADARGRREFENRNYPHRKYLNSLLSAVCAMNVRELLLKNDTNDPAKLIRSNRLMLIESEMSEYGTTNV
ncbi:multifunctional CCA addition/repair protein [Gammaproteobacteria bacterium]|nr:multifunctional CCA addition/repair protein [Gammaproteobacteria bacterium]